MWPYGSTGHSTNDLMTESCDLLGKTSYLNCVILGEERLQSTTSIAIVTSSTHLPGYSYIRKSGM